MIMNKAKELEIIEHYLSQLFVRPKAEEYGPFREDTEDLLKQMYKDAFTEGYNTRKNEVVNAPERGYTDTQMLIKQVTDGIRELLFYKNEKYGDSALHPTKIFSKLEADNSICIRIDDKISRIMNGEHLLMNDVIDLMGYLILLCASKEWTDFNKFRD